MKPSFTSTITGVERAWEGRGLKIISLSWVSSRHNRQPVIDSKVQARGGSFSSGLAVLGAGRLTESERCLIWEYAASLSFLDTRCPHNLQLRAVSFS